MIILAVCLAATVAAMPAMPPGPVYHDPSLLLHTNMLVTPEDADQLIYIASAIPKAPELPPLDLSLAQVESKSESLLDEHVQDLKLPKDAEPIDIPIPEHFEEEKSKEIKPEKFDKLTMVHEKPDEIHVAPEKHESYEHEKTEEKPFDKPNQTTQEKPEEIYLALEQHETYDKFEEKPFEKLELVTPERPYVAPENHESLEKLEEKPFENPERPYVAPENHESSEKLEEKPFENPEDIKEPSTPEKPFEAIEIKPEPYVEQFTPIIIPMQQNTPSFWSGWFNWPKFSLPSLSSFSLSNLANFLPVKLPFISSSQSPLPVLSNISSTLENFVPVKLPSILSTLPSLSSLQNIPSSISSLSSSIPILSSLSSRSPAVSSLPKLQYKPYYMRNYMVLPNRYEDQRNRANVYSYVY